MLEYACHAFHTSSPQYLSDGIEHIQRRASRIIYQDLSYIDLETFYERRTMLCEELFSNIVSNPHHILAERIPAENRKFNIKRTKTNIFLNIFNIHQAAKL